MSAEAVDLDALGAVDAEGLRDRVGAALEQVLARQAAVLTSVSPELGAVLPPLRDLLSGGKRLRPAFCYWGWRGGGGGDRGDGSDAIVAVAAALELFHVAALVHDDVMDDSDTRRGLPAVHRRFAELHQTRGWQGSAAQFGLAGAILAGDLCLSWADEVFAAAAFSADRLAAARPVFDQMKTELMCGQYLDMLGQALDATSVERARQVIHYKTSRYSVQAPLVLGGTLAGAPAPVLRAYEDYGNALGEAFQLRDDVLGVFGDPAMTGKPAGDDLREGKRTMLVAMALERCGPAKAADLSSRLGDPALEPAGIARLRSLIVASGALDAVESLVAERAAAAMEALDPVPEPARGVLERLVTAATQRTV